MPPVVLAIPFFIMLGKFSLLDTLAGLIIVYIVLLMPIAVWIMVDFFNKVPVEIDETALIDGCNPLQAFYKVVLPNSCGFEFVNHPMVELIGCCVGERRSFGVSRVYC